VLYNSVDDDARRMLCVYPGIAQNSRVDRHPCFSPDSGQPVVPFPQHHTDGTIHYVAFSGWLLSLGTSHLRSPDALMVRSFGCAVCIPVGLFSHRLEDILVTFKFSSYE
jgi:hypothetical protein